MNQPSRFALLVILSALWRAPALAEQLIARTAPAAMALPAAALPPALGLSAEYFDASAQPPSVRWPLLFVGFRMEEGTGRLLAPETGAPLTVAQWREQGKASRDAMARRALLQLAFEPPVGSGQPVSERVAALFDGNRGVLPPEVLKTATDPIKGRAVVLRRLASLHRRWLERVDPPVSGIVQPVGAEAEEKLGRILSAAIVRRFERSSEGRNLLSSLTDSDGSLVLPTVRVLRLDGLANALYMSYGRQLIFDLGYVREVLTARLPPSERPRAVQALATEAGALAYFGENAAVADRFVETVEETIYHELVHHEADRRRPLHASRSRGEVSPLVTVEEEHEAFFRQNMYVNSLLEGNAGKADFARGDSFMDLIVGFENWKRKLDALYSAPGHFSNSYSTLDELRRMHAFSRDLLERLSRLNAQPSPAAKERLAAAERGTQALEIERRTADAMLGKFRATWSRLERKAAERWAATNRRTGRWVYATLAEDRLALLDGARSHRAKAELDAHFALLRLSAPKGLTTEQRVEWVNALSARLVARREPWPKALWKAFLSAYEDMAAESRAAARQYPESAAAFTARAETFEKSRENHLAQLRRSAEENLREARTTNEVKRTRELIRQGLDEAEVLKDAALLRAFGRLDTTPRR